MSSLASTYIVQKQKCKLSVLKWRHGLSLVERETSVFRISFMIPSSSKVFLHYRRRERHVGYADGIHGIECRPVVQAQSTRSRHTRPDAPLHLEQSAERQAEERARAQAIFSQYCNIQRAHKVGYQPFAK